MYTKCDFHTQVWTISGCAAERSCSLQLKSVWLSRREMGFKAALSTSPSANTCYHSHQPHTHSRNARSANTRFHSHQPHTHTHGIHCATETIVAVCYEQSSHAVGQALGQALTRTDGQPLTERSAPYLQSSLCRQQQTNRHAVSLALTCSRKRPNEEAHGRVANTAIRCQR
jgi:hypothetical protein